jgi:hypothetical protein
MLFLFKVELLKKIVKFVKCIKSKCLSLINLKLIMSTIMINMIYTSSLPLIHCIFYIVLYTTLPYFDRGCRGRDRIVVGFTNYRCNQCLSPLKLSVLISLMVRCTCTLYNITMYVIKFVSDLRQFSGFL